MNNLIKFGFILTVFVNISYSEELNKSIFNTKLPKIELEANTGLAWIMQFKGNINITDNIYSKFRISETLLASEYGFTVGYQRSYNNKSRLQMGIGYSKGNNEPFVPGGPNPDDTTEHWNGLIIEANYIHYFNNGIMRIGFNVGFNFIIASSISIPSLNLGLIIGAF